MIRYFYLATCLLTCFFAKGQAPSADFSASVTSGCAPVQVTFKDLSTGNPKFWNWDFGNGQLSNLQNPTAVYYTPGKYTVKFVVRNADGTDGITKTDYITVNPSPAAEFNSSATLTCQPAVVQFSDLSTPNGGSITKWEWDFGDGSTSTTPSPQKTYLNNGFYTVTLKVTASTGCQNINSKFRLIRVVSGVSASFLDSIPKVCEPPIGAYFFNETSGPGNLSYSWDFGNGSLSTATDPTATFITAGSFKVRLIARSDLGCSDTTEKQVNISNTSTEITAPDSTCEDQPVIFRTNSSGQPLKTTWDFGDGSASSQQNPTKSYGTPQVYSVKLINEYVNCIDSAVKSITVLGPPSVDFSADKLVDCKAPLTVNFQDQSSAAVSWQWDFGDGTKGSGKNVSHTYTKTGDFDVTLTITSAFGCQNTLKKTAYIRIIPPTASIANVPAGGCIPYTFSPVASVNAIDGVASYAWDFGDGNTGSGVSPSNIYPNVGNYAVKLTITTIGGCITTVNVPGGVSTGTPVSVDFTAVNLVSCASDSVQFTYLSSPQHGQLWDFGDGTTSLTKNPKHLYDTTGVFTVSLTAINNGCPSLATKANYVTIKPPVAKFDYKADCNNRLSVGFLDQSITDGTGPVTYDWNFGHASIPNSTSKNPTVTFPSFGTYTVILKTTIGACSDTAIRTVIVAGEKADFNSPDVTICKNDQFTATAINSNAQNITSYEWKVDQGFFAGGRSITAAVATKGIHDVTLRITDINGCTDTKTIPAYLTVSGPTAAFTAIKDKSCTETSVLFDDQSTPASDIRKWTFDFGDGTKTSFTKGPFAHIYKDTGTFAVRLTIEDKQGCTDGIALNTPILITRPVIAFQAAQTKSCPGAPLQFIDSSKGVGLSYAWDFGDGTTSTLKDPLHTYTGPNKIYSVKLSIMDISGCKDSLTKTGYIDVRAPKAAFDMKDSVAICPPLETKFTSKSADYESLFWEFGDGGNSKLKDPAHFYNVYGNYTVKLYATGFGGCIDSAEHTVNLYNPYETKIQYTVPSTVCNSLLVDFNITTPPSTAFTFYYGDGGSDNSQNKTLKYFYPTPGFQSPYLVLKDSMDCLVTVGGPEVIRIIGAEPFFSVDRKKFCDTGVVYFTNFTIGNDPVVSDTWDFGDGVTSTDKDPAHNYAQPGLYVFSHIVQTQSGCSKTLTDTIRVYRTPETSINAADMVCINSPIKLQGVLAVPDTAITWKWNLGNGQNATTQDVDLTYTRDALYDITVEATNLLGCKSSASDQVKVVPLPVITVPEQPVIIVGTGVNLPVSYSSNVSSYKWTPATDLDCTNCPNPFATPKFNRTYKVDVVDSNTCKNSAEITVSVICTNKNYFVPNTFTPNRDGVNDVFYPRGSGIDRVQSMRIYSRWGELVFEKRNFPVNSSGDGWDGTFRGKPANADVYVYVVEFICENAAIVPYKGNVALIR